MEKDVKHAAKVLRNRIGMLPLTGYFLILFYLEETGKVVTNILQASGHFRFIQFAFRA